MRNVCVVGLGFVGSAMATAIAVACDKKKPIYTVVGLDLANEQGIKKVDSINSGSFPFVTDDNNLLSSFSRAINQGNLRATTDKSVYSEMDIIVVDIHLDIDFFLFEKNPDYHVVQGNNPEPEFPCFWTCIYKSTSKK